MLHQSCPPALGCKRLRKGMIGAVCQPASLPVIALVLRERIAAPSARAPIDDG